jgi:hypothetical protein
MEWINKTQDSWNFQGQANPQHGTPPTPSVSPLPAGGSSTVTTSSHSSISGPGPEGAYQWQVQSSSKPLIQCSYNHPFGNGTTFVTITCPPGYEAASCGQGPAESITVTSNNCTSLNDHSNSNCQITVTQS